MTDAERLTRLEERYLHLQHHSTGQDKVMLELGNEVARLQAEVAALRARLARGDETGAPTEEAPPPHY